jgi:signal transduction histidine kinase
MRSRRISVVATRNSRDQLRALAELQSSLRRVATEVARGGTPSEVFSTVADELARCLDVHHTTLVRFEVDGGSVLLATHDDRGPAMPVGTRFPSDGENIAAMVFHTGRSARMDSHDNASGPAAAMIRAAGLDSAVGAPIVVDGHVWGATIVGSSHRDPLPADTESRLGDFADLAATAIANAETRAQLTASRARSVSAGDDARRRFERDLHDGAQQRLVALGLKLRAAEAAVPDDLESLRRQSRRSWTIWSRPPRICRTYRVASIPRFSRGGDCRRSRRWRAAPPFRLSSTWASTGGCRLCRGRGLLRRRGIADEHRQTCWRVRGDGEGRSRRR